MLIGNPLGEGSNASSTNSVAVLAFLSGELILRGNSNAQEWCPRHKPGPDQLK